MRTAFFANTSYQLFNAVNYAYHKKKTLIESDIYILKRFINNEIIINNLEHLKLFDNVYVLNEWPLQPGGRLEQFFSKLFARKFINKHLANNKKINFKKKKYNEVFIVELWDFQFLLTIACRAENNNFIDDGLGSYTGVMTEHKLGRNVKLFQKIMGFKIEIKKLYLNCPELYKRDEFETVKLPDNNMDDPEYLNILNSIFPCRNIKKYRDFRFVYLHQPIQGLQSAFKGINVVTVEKNILEICDVSACLFRLHPANYVNDTDLFINKNVDSDGDLWEIICANEIADSHILISCMSTAAFIPKILFNKEPYLIFTYKLYDDDALFIQPYKELIENLKKIYKEPQKIICPASYIDLKYALLKLSNGE
ncbi:MAG: hypothetical protein LBR74_02275 [Eubacterium sp.]|jgi:hypothetical protein|nr:hypothetical protein [Eubacterium sp.]